MSKRRFGRRPSRNAAAGRDGRTPLPAGSFVYITLEDYGSNESAAARSEIIGDILSRHSRRSLLAMIGRIRKSCDALVHDTEIEDEFFSQLRQLDPSTADRLEARFREKLDGHMPRILFSPQGTLIAARSVLINGVDVVERNLHHMLVFDAGWLIHLLSTDMGAAGSSSGDSSLLMEVVQNQSFNNRAIPRNRLATTMTLWKDFAAGASAGESAWEKLRAALGADPDAVRAVLFVMWTIAIQGKPLINVAELKECFKEEDGITAALGAALELVAAAPERLAAMFDTSAEVNQSWDIGPFEMYPVVRLGHELIVIDPDLLLDRMSSGLFWAVHDHQKAVGGEAGRSAWMTQWSKAVEQMAEAIVTDIAVLKKGAVTFTEEDFGPGPGRRADIGLQAGNDLVLFEVYSGGPTVKTRFRGDSEAWDADLYKMVMAKAEQLDETASRIAGGTQLASGTTIRSWSRLVPLVVHAWRLPWNLAVDRHVHGKLRDQGLLQQPGVTTLGVVTLWELVDWYNCVVSDHGQLLREPIRVLAQWRTSQMRGWPFDHYLVAENLFSRRSGLWPRFEAARQEFEQSLARSLHDRYAEIFADRSIAAS